MYVGAPKLPMAYTNESFSVRYVRFYCKKVAELELRYFLTLSCGGSSRTIRGKLTGLWYPVQRSFDDGCIAARDG